MPVSSAPPSSGTEPTRRAGIFPARSVLVVDVYQLVGTVLGNALRCAGFDAHELAVGDHDSIVAAAARYPDAVVLLEPALGPDPAGRPIGAVELIAALTRQGNHVLVLSESLDRPGAVITVGAAITAGAEAFVPKSMSLDSLLRILGQVTTGRPVMSEAEHLLWVACHDRHQRRVRERERRLDRLSPREHDVLALLGTGYRAAAIAERYVVSLATVRTQIGSVLVKLEVCSQLEAVALLFDIAFAPGGEDRSGEEARVGGHRRPTSREL